MGEGLLRYWVAYESTGQGERSRQSALNLIAGWSQFAGRPVIHDSAVRKVAFTSDGEAVLTLT